jgi:hypothetical protein
MRKSPMAKWLQRHPNSAIAQAQELIMALDSAGANVYSGFHTRLEEIGFESYNVDVLSRLLDADVVTSRRSLLTKQK